MKLYRCSGDTDRFVCCIRVVVEKSLSSDSLLCINVFFLSQTLFCQ